MKIAFIGQKGLPATFGGVERHVEELAIRLVKQGHSVSVYSRQWYTGSKNPNYQGIDLLYTKSIHTKNLDAITGTFTATIDAMRRGFDVIHFQGVGPALLSFLPRLFSPRSKVVVTFHCQDRLHGKWGLFARLVLALGERAACYFPHETIVVSKTLKKYTAVKYHCNATYIPNGVNLPKKTPFTDILEHLGVKKNRYFLSVTRLISHKATHQLIQAFQLLKQENSYDLTHDLKLVIVGEGVHTDKYVKTLKQLAEGDPDIVFAGWQGGENLSTLYANAKMFIHPSYSEGLPLVVLEAMSYGLPVVASDILEHQELINDKRFLFAVGKIRDLQRTLFWVLQNPNLALSQGLANRSLVAQEFNLDKAVEKLNLVYQDFPEVISSTPHFTVKKIGAKL